MNTLFIGLGMMGEPMARNLAASTSLAVFDVNAETRERLGAELGVRTLESTGALPSDIDAVVLMVPNSRIVEGLLRGPGGILDQLPAGALIIDMSSSEPNSTTALAAEAAEIGIEYVDAPVSGGVGKARTGELAIIVGATAVGYTRALPLLETMGASIVHVGEPGSGHAAKALNNLLSATNIAAAAEILTAAGRFGIAPEVMLDVINASTGRSQASEVKYPNFVLTGSFASGFGMDLMLKDLAIAQSLTAGAGVECPVTGAAATVATAARAFAATPPDHTEIVKYYEHFSEKLLRSTAA